VRTFRSTVLIRSGGHHKGERFCDAARSILPSDLDDEADRDESTVMSVFNLYYARGEPHVGLGRHGRRESNLVDAVVETRSRGVDRVQLFGEGGDECEGEIAVRNCLPERTGGGPFEIDVHPLMVARGRGELVHTSLPDPNPASWAEGFAASQSQLLHRPEGLHTILSRHLDVCGTAQQYNTYYPFI
jgi:hypothetical protein